MTLTTTEELRLLASSDNTNELMRRLARECLANQEAQPVGTVKSFSLGCFGELLRPLPEGTPLYTAPPAPAVPDDVRHLKNVQELYHSQEERLFALAQRIKGASFDKYSHTTAQAIDVLEREIFGDDDNAYRAAMLAQPVSQGYKLPPHAYRELVNSLRDTAAKYHGTQQLREQLSRTLTENGLVAAALEGGNG